MVVKKSQAAQGYDGEQLHVRGSQTFGRARRFALASLAALVRAVSAPSAEP